MIELSTLDQRWIYNVCLFLFFFSWWGGGREAHPSSYPPSSHLMIEMPTLIQCWIYDICLILFFCLDGGWCLPPLLNPNPNPNPNPRVRVSLSGAHGLNPKSDSRSVRLPDSPNTSFLPHAPTVYYLEQLKKNHEIYASCSDHAKTIRRQTSVPRYVVELSETNASTPCLSSYDLASPRPLLWTRLIGCTALRRLWKAD